MPAVSAVHNSIRKRKGLQKLKPVTHMLGLHACILGAHTISRHDFPFLVVSLNTLEYAPSRSLSTTYVIFVGEIAGVLA